MRTSNGPVVLWSLVFLGLIGTAWAVTEEYELGPIIPYGLFFLFVMYLIRMRHGFGDPATISLFTFSLYATLPLLSVDAPSATDFGFDLAGAAYIYSVASVAMLAATGLAFAVFPSPDEDKSGS